MAEQRTHLSTLFFLKMGCVCELIMMYVFVFDVQVTVHHDKFL